MNADDFVITKRRKKYKFARFAELPNCYEVAEWKESGFKNATLSHYRIELGAGTGLFLLEHARNNPDQIFVAIDVKADRLYTGAKKAAEEHIGNIFFVRAHASQLIECFAPHSVSELWLTFSDPYPKKRHAKHRMTHQKFLRLYQLLLDDKGLLYFKTDNHALFDWTLMQLVQFGAFLRHLDYDLHQSSLPEECKIMTSYEQRFVREGLPIYFVSAYFPAAS